MGIVTDCTPVESPKEPDRCNVFALYSLFATEEEKAAPGSSVQGRRFRLRRGERHALAESRRVFRPLPRRTAKELAAKPEAVEEVLRQGAERARKEAGQTMDLVRRAVGMGALPGCLITLFRGRALLPGHSIAANYQP